MESFTKELLFNASAQFFPNKTLSSFENFLPDQLNPEGQWDVAFLQLSYTSMF